MVKRKQREKSEENVRRSERNRENGSRMKELPVWYEIKLNWHKIPHQMFSFTLVVRKSSEFEWKSVKSVEV
jgi:hypothetical protein